MEPRDESSGERMTKKTVLFLCQHNAGRSQLAAGVLEHLDSEHFDPTSAGISPAYEVNAAVAASVAEWGVDIAGRVPRAVTAQDIASADVVVTMKPGLRLPADPGPKLVEWQFPDPASWSVEDVRPLRDAVAARIRDELLPP